MPLNCEFLKYYSIELKCIKTKQKNWNEEFFKEKILNSMKLGV